MKQVSDDQPRNQSDKSATWQNSSVPKKGDITQPIPAPSGLTDQASHWYKQQTKGPLATHSKKDIKLHTNQWTSCCIQTKGTHSTQTKWRHATYRPKELILHTDQMTSCYIQTKGIHSTHRPEDVMLHTDQRTHSTHRPKDVMLHTDQRTLCYIQTKGTHSIHRPKIFKLHTDQRTSCYIQTKGPYACVHKWVGQSRGQGGHTLKNKVRSLSKKKVLLAGDASRLTSAGRFVASTHCIMSYPPSRARLSLVTDFDTWLYCSTVARGTHTHTHINQRSDGRRECW